MSCYSPLKAFKTASGVFFDASSGGVPVTLPCGQCIGCRLERSRQWAVRAMHEASLHDVSDFITLTYDDSHLPSDGSLSVPELQKFFKRARRSGAKFRYLACGEYGDRGGRPHYHALVFGHKFSASSLERIWPFGFAYQGDVTFDSAAYVARYNLKKQTGKNADKHYERVNTDTGEIYWLQPEFIVSSKRPAIGRQWIEKFMMDTFAPGRDSVIVSGREVSVPRYYSKQLEKFSESLYSDTKLQRVRAFNSLATPGILSPRRLGQARDVRVARLALSRRKL